jgi:hypothetical protein
MTEDGWLIGLTAVVWGVLALLYATVPMFSMPGSALIWCSGAILFVGLAALVVRAERRRAS